MAPPQIKYKTKVKRHRRDKNKTYYIIDIALIKYFIFILFSIDYRVPAIIKFGFELLVLTYKSYPAFEFKSWGQLNFFFLTW